MAQLAPVLAIVGFIWYVVAAWRNDYRILAGFAVGLLVYGVLVATGALHGTGLRYGSYAAQIAGTAVVLGSVLAGRKLVMPFLLLVVANVVLVMSGVHPIFKKERLPDGGGAQEPAQTTPPPAPRASEPPPPQPGPPPPPR